ncbi:MAG: DUF3850 domain-containing protein [Patescibacteria group bacterium]
MTTIHKKVWREYFEKIISGKKKLELRLADFEVNEGDTLVLEEWDKDKKEYTGRKVEVIANYILKTKGQTFWSPEEVEKHGFQIIQFEIKSRPGYYLGTIIEESLEDGRVLNDFHILGVRITNDDNPAERWHLYKVEATPEQLQKLSSILKPEKWYAHFWSGDEMIVVFRDKTFTQKVGDMSTWEPAIQYGLSIGIPKEQLDFLTE